MPLPLHTYIYNEWSPTPLHEYIASDTTEFTPSDLEVWTTQGWLQRQVRYVLSEQSVTTLSAYQLREQTQRAADLAVVEGVYHGLQITKEMFRFLDPPKKGNNTGMFKYRQDRIPPQFAHYFASIAYEYPEDADFVKMNAAYMELRHKISTHFKHPVRSVSFYSYE